MNRLALTMVAVAAMTPTAYAADVMMSPPPMAAPVTPIAASSSWTGFYVGAFGGLAFDPSDAGVIEIDQDLDGDFDEPIVGALADAFRQNFFGENQAGGFAGLEAGYDLQIDRFVVGGTIDIAYIDYAERQSGFSNTPAFYNQIGELDYLATIGGRAGALVTDDFLVYGLASLAYGEVDYRFDSNNPNGTSRGGADQDFGYQIGAGVEARLTDNLSFGVEYAYTNLGGNNFTTRFNNPGPTNPFDDVNADGSDLRGTQNDFDFHTISASLKYRF